MNTRRILVHWLMLAFALLFLVLMLLLPVSAPAGFEAGVDAYGRSDREPAYRERLPLVEPADADVRNG